MKLPAIRGAILEEIVLYLLREVGYRVVRAGEEGTRAGKSGLEVRGRGDWHQIDALAAYDRSPAFMYPLRIMVEAKCYQRGSKVGLPILRNAVGVQKDISENFFTYRPTRTSKDKIQAPRFNYHSAIFSTSGYTANAQRYAVAHQIFLIQYARLGLFRPIIDGLLGLSDEHFTDVVAGGQRSDAERAVRQTARSLLDLPVDAADVIDHAFSDVGLAYFTDRVVKPLDSIRGSYFGVLQGRWPMHLLSRQPLPSETFSGTDVVECKIFGFEADTWSFSPVHLNEGDRGWFRLDFDLPDEIIELVAKARENPVEIANVKQAHFSFLDVSGKIGDVQRQVRLRLSDQWINSYLDRMRRRNP